MKLTAAEMERRDAAREILDRAEHQHGVVFLAMRDREAGHEIVAVYRDVPIARAIDADWSTAARRCVDAVRPEMCRRVDAIIRAAALYHRNERPWQYAL